MTLNTHTEEYTRTKIQCPKYKNFCLASKCAMWRFIAPTGTDATPTGEEVPARGYCGLGGKP